MAEIKREFLVGYDYGMAGLWGIMQARSENEIHALYPELQIAAERPPWMTDEIYARLHDIECHDIDGMPWGMLSAVIADRHR